MAHYTVHVARSHMGMGPTNPLTGWDAYKKVCELQAAGVQTVTVRNVETGEEVADVASIILDKPNA